MARGPGGDPAQAVGHAQQLRLAVGILRLGGLGLAGVGVVVGDRDHAVADVDDARVEHPLVGVVAHQAAAMGLEPISRLLAHGPVAQPDQVVEAGGEVAGRQHHERHALLDGAAADALLLKVDIGDGEHRHVVEGLALPVLADLAQVLVVLLLHGQVAAVSGLVVIGAIVLQRPCSRLDAKEGHAAALPQGVDGRAAEVRALVADQDLKVLDAAGHLLEDVPVHLVDLEVGEHGAVFLVGLGHDLGTLGVSENNAVTHLLSHLLHAFRQRLRQVVKHTHSFS